MAIITTLPVTPGKHDHFVTLMSQILADLAAKFLKADHRIILNTTTSIGNADFSVNVQSYQTQLANVGVSHSVQLDSSTGYCDFVEKSVKKLESTGNLYISTEEMSFCPCGRVEFPTVIISTEISSRIKKVIERRADAAFCRVCQGKIISMLTRVLRVKFADQPAVKILPPRTVGEFMAVANRVKQSGLIISRHNRKGQQVAVGGQNFVLDTDFRWQLLGDYWKDTDELILVAGNDLVNQAAKMFLVSIALNPTVKFSIIFHPLINIAADDPLYHLTIDQFCDLAGNPLAIRTLMTLAMQQSRPCSAVAESDLYWVGKSIIPQGEVNIPIQLESDSQLADFLRIFCKNNLLGLLKSLRSKPINLSIDQAIAWRILNII